MAGSSQKFIARNRAPRVQIEYDVELYGAEKKVQLPFVMGVMSDLSGKSLAEPPAVADRKFVEIDVDNFDDRMKAMAPRAAFSVPNTLTGEGQLSVDLTFEKMADFTPAAVARKVAPLRALLEARERLSHLATYMDGKVGAEVLIERLLADPSALASLAAALPDAEEGETAQALATLHDARLPESPADDDSAVLDALRAAAPVEEPAAETTAEVLAGIARSEDAPGEDHHDAILARMERREDNPAADDPGAVLDRLERSPDEPPEGDTAGDVLAGVARAEDTPETDERGDVLSRMERSEEGPVTDETGDVLGNMDRAPDDEPEADAAGDVLAGIDRAEAPEDTDTSADVLAAMERREVTPPHDKVGAVLEGVERGPEMPAEESGTDDVLAGMERAEPTSEADHLSTLLTDLDRADSAASAHDDAQAQMPDLGAEGDAEVEEEATAEDDDPELAALMAGLEDDEDGAPDPDLSMSEDEPETVEAEEDSELAALMAGLDEDDDDDAEDPELAALMAGLDDETTTEDATPPAEPEADVTGEVANDDDEDPELAALMAGLDRDEDSENAEEDPELAALMAGLEDDEDASPEADLSMSEDEPETDDAEEDPELAALMAGLDEDDDDDAEDPELAALMAGLDDETTTEDATPSAEPEADVTGEVVDDDDEDPELAALMAGLEDDEDATPEPDLSMSEDGTETDDAEEDAELAALMAGLDEDDDDDAEDPELVALMAGLDDSPAAEGDEDDELSALMAGLESDGDADEEDDELAKLMSGLDDDDAGSGDDELEGLMAGLDGDDGTSADEAQDLTLSDEAENAFGTMGAERPEPTKLQRQRFRIALFGDFSGRAARGLRETGEALAAREGVVLDCDSVEEIIEGFATTLVLPLGKDGQGMEVSLKELDDLHPDELYEKLPIFAELKGLRQQLGGAATAQGAADKLRHWGEAHGVAVRPPHRHSGANTVRADLKLSDFEKLIGATEPAPRATASPMEDLLARVVGPHVRKAQGADAAAMQKAVDEALSAAMRMVLHHPDFQAIEAQWRTLDLIARSIETDDSLEVMLYDLSAEEIAADIAAHDDLSLSGLARLLTEKPLDEENGRGPFSVLVGLYTFEETPPHAELLGRIARIAAHVDAPFVTAITPDFIDTKMEDRHPLVAGAWDTLRAMPEARHLGLVSPRFLLRRPYGAKSEPIYEFDFEEFTMAEGLSGMLWANPAVLPAILMAQSFRKNGMGLQLGSVMSLGGMPYHFVTDRHGDQVALPCTERNFSVDKHTVAVRRGYMPVLSVKGRDEVRLGSFNAVGGEELLGPWSKVPPPPPSPPKPPRPAPAPVAAEEEDTPAGFDSGSDDDDLEALLAGFNDSSDDDDDGDGDLDAELAALLNDL